MGLNGIHEKSVPGSLTSLTYRSRAVDRMSEGGLRELERTSQSRNRVEGLTGFTVYDDGTFFQWLEGPADSLDRVWTSVRQDRRHTDIADLTIRSTPARLFEGWDMALAIRGTSPLPPLARRATRLSLVAALEPLRAIVAGEAPAVWGKGEAAAPVIPLVPVLVEALILPEMFSKLGTVRRFLPPVSPAAAGLTSLLLADDPAPAAKALRKLYARAGSLAPLCATVIEPAARGLGDLWLADDCSELAMTAALFRLQSIVRRLAATAGPLAMGLPAILVAPQPGEAHLLGAGLDAELLWQAGWDTHREFPATGSDLDALVAATWFDVLDLSLSAAMPRRESLASMAETITSARAASLNPALTVLVGGRAFFERQEATAAVGADASVTSALHVVIAAAAAHAVTLAKSAKSAKLADRQVEVPRS